MTTPLKAIDDLLDPMIKAALVVRGIRDNIPRPLWELVPDVLQKPLDDLFVAIEAYDRRVGLMRDAGLFD